MVFTVYKLEVFFCQVKKNSAAGGWVGGSSPNFCWIGGGWNLANPSFSRIVDFFNLIRPFNKHQLFHRIIAARHFPINIKGGFSSLMISAKKRGQIILNNSFTSYCSGRLLNFY